MYQCWKQSLANVKLPPKIFFSVFSRSQGCPSRSWRNPGPSIVNVALQSATQAVFWGSFLWTAVRRALWFGLTTDLQSYRRDYRGAAGPPAYPLIHNSLRPGFPLAWDPDATHLKSLHQAEPPPPCPASPLHTLPLFPTSPHSFPALPRQSVRHHFVQCLPGLGLRCTLNGSRPWVLLCS